MYKIGNNQKFLFATALLAVSGLAVAEPTEWTIYNAVLNNGAKVSGSFVLDGGVFAKIDIHVAAGSDYEAATFTRVIDVHPLWLSVTFVGDRGLWFDGSKPGCGSDVGMGSQPIGCGAQAFTIALVGGNFLQSNSPYGISAVNSALLHCAHDDCNQGKPILTADYWTFYGARVYPSTPAVPEPSTYALMLAGLGAVACAARARRRASC